MLDLSVCSNFDFRSEEYKVLFEQADVTAFQHPVWHHAMQQYLKNFPDIEERTLQMRCKKSGCLVGLFPLIARKKLGATIFEYANMSLVDYALPTMHKDIGSWIPDPDYLSKRLLETLGAYDVLRVKHMPFNDPAVLRLFPSGNFQRADFSAYVTDLVPDYQEWRLANISKSERKHRDKKRRAMMREGNWQMHRLVDEEPIRVAMDHLRTFHKERYKDRPGEDLIQRPVTFDFYVNLAIENAASGYVRLYQFTYDDQIVAVQYAIEHNGRYLMLMMGLDFERVGRYSPGLLMTEDLIEECIKEGMQIFDFTVGDEPYKLKFGTRKMPIFTLWHTHSVLGNVGLTVAEAMNRTPISERLRRWVS
nr:GNAT family N-acetyltransferase [uncultured Cohaesibacter sp.]